MARLKLRVLKHLKPKTPWESPLREGARGFDTFLGPIFRTFCMLLGLIFQIFCPLWVPFLSFHPFKVVLFHLSTLGLSKRGIMSALGCQKLDFVSALGSIFNCFTTLGWHLSVGPPSCHLN